MKFSVGYVLVIITAIAVVAGMIVFANLRSPSQVKRSGEVVATPAVFTFRNDSRGLALIQLHHCAACHVATDAALQQIVHPAAGPDLRDTGLRLQEAWLRNWLASHFTDALPENARTETIEDLGQYLLSQRNTGSFESWTTEEAGDAERGRALVDSIGCAACHGPSDASSLTLELLRTYVAIDNQTEKTNTAALAAFLHDPLRWLPDGRMPGMSLSHEESRDIAAWMMKQNGEAGSFDFPMIDAERVERGRAAFHNLLCSSCHMNTDKNNIADRSNAQMRVMAFENLHMELEDGCLADDWTSESGGMSFNLSAGDRAVIRTWLRAASRAPSIMPEEVLSAAMIRLDCLRCHAIDGKGGPEPALWELFIANHPDLPPLEAQPPALDQFPARLQLQWIDEVMNNHAQARSYLRTRMPEFGTEASGEILTAVAALKSDAHKNASTESGEHANDETYIEAGRELLSIGGLNCISCHPIGSEPSNGLPGVNLATVPYRLDRDYFEAWLRSPQSIRPNTRMPAFFAGDSSPVRFILEGDASQQIEAIWQYLKTVHPKE
ncbi:MAG: c-type cytochrome [Phycisphaerales bacterium]